VTDRPDRRQRLVWRLFPMLERLGIHVTRAHFYEPVPDTRSLPDHLWDEPSALVGVDLGAARQLELLDSLAARYGDEWATFPDRPPPVGPPHAFHLRNGQFERVDAEALYGLVRLLGPRRIVEVGGGHSTRLAAAAIARNLAGDPPRPCELVTVEPHPDETLRAGFPGLARLVAKPVQEVPLDVFTSLEKDDVLFVDSSHVVKIGSDAQYLLLEVLPRLAPGVVIHLHDVFLPAEYPRHLVLDYHRFWNEQYVLQALLTFTSAFEVLWASSFLHLRHPDRLTVTIPSYGRGGLWPSSIWLRRREGAV
jgi:predicted O-methyltransferase YrrM